MTMSENKDLILVIGGTGKTGRRVADRLRARGVPIRIGTPSTDPPFDWLDPSTWAPAVQGVDAAYVTYSTPGGGDIAFSGAADRVRAFAKVAVENGVRHLVLLSGPERARCAERRAGDPGIGRGLDHHPVELLRPGLQRVLLARGRAERRGRVRGR